MPGKKEIVTGKLQLSLHLMVDKRKLLGSSAGPSNRVPEVNAAPELLPVKPKVLLILFCFVLFCFVLFCFVLFCFV
jgi:hypothetical protein